MKIIQRRWFVQFLGTMLVFLILAAVQPAFALPGADKNQASVQTAGLGSAWVVRHLEETVARVQPLLDRYGYPAVFLTVLVEGFGLVAPGQTLLIAAGLAAAKGGLNIAWVLAIAFAAAVLGNSLGYLLGLRGGRSLLKKVKVSEERLQGLEAGFRRYGKGMVLFARFFDGPRQLNGIVAGLLKMPWKEFTTFNILGAALWVGLWGLGAYWLEKEIASLHLVFHTFKPWVAAGAVLGFLALLVFLLRRRQNQS